MLLVLVAKKKKKKKKFNNHLLITQTELAVLPFYFRVMLTSALRELINNSVKKSFYGKRKKAINVLIIFFIFHKSDIKTFLK